MNNKEILEQLKKVNPEYLVCGTSFTNDYTEKMKDIKDLNGVTYICDQGYWEEDLSMDESNTLRVGEVVEKLKSQKEDITPQLDIEDGFVFRDLSSVIIRDDLKVVIVNT